MFMMREEYLRELGLSPLWHERKAALLATDTIVAPPLSAAADGDNDVLPPPALTPVTAGESLIQRMDWDSLRQAASICQNCDLANARKNVVFGVGDRQAQMMFIGEGPGAEEDRRGEPFVGRAGHLLNMMMHAIALNRNQGIYIANIVKCRPPDNRNPTHQEARTCLAYLRRQIALVRPRLLVALGKVAASHLLQTESSIGQLRQKMHDYDGIPLVVTYHPAYLLRSPLEKRKSWDDLRFIRRLLQEDKENQ